MGDGRWGLTPPGLPPWRLPNRPFTTPAPIRPRSESGNRSQGGGAQLLGAVRDGEYVAAADRLPLASKQDLRAGDKRLADTGAKKADLEFGRDHCSPQHERAGERQRVVGEIAHHAAVREPVLLIELGPQRHTHLQPPVRHRDEFGADQHTERLRGERFTPECQEVHSGDLRRMQKDDNPDNEPTTSKTNANARTHERTNAKRKRDNATRRQGDKATRRQGDKARKRKSEGRKAGRQEGRRFTVLASQCFP